MKHQMWEKKYPAYIVNKCLAPFQDTIFLVNEMNIHHQTDKKLQFDFLLNTIRPKKRWSKWIKRENNDILELIKKYYNCSYTKARDYSTLLDDSQLDIIRQNIELGGLKGTK